MGLISRLATGVVETPTRWVTILDAAPTVGTNAVQVQVSYVSQDEYSGFGQKCPNRDTVTADRNKFRKLMGGACVKGFREILPNPDEQATEPLHRPGLSRENIRQLSPYYALRPAEWKKLPDIVVPDANDIVELVQELDEFKWSRLIVTTALYLEGFVLDQLEQEKKDSAPSSDTSSVSPLPNPASDG